MSRPSHQPEHKQQLLLHDHCDTTAVDDLTNDPQDRLSYTSSCDDFEYTCGMPKTFGGSSGSSQYANVRPGSHLSQGVAHLLQMWPRSMVSLLWTVGLIVATCFVIVLTILLLVLSTNFSLDSDFVLTHRTRSRSIQPTDLQLDNDDDTADLVNELINLNNGDDLLDTEHSFDNEHNGIMNPAGNSFINDDRRGTNRDNGFINVENDVMESENDVRNSNNKGDVARFDGSNELARGLTTSLNEGMLLAATSTGVKDLNDDRRTFRYILNASDDRINLFYVIDASKTHRLSAHALNVLRYYVRAGYQVYVIRVCRTRIVTGEDSERLEKPVMGGQQRQKGKLRSERVVADDTRHLRDGDDEKQQRLVEKKLSEVDGKLIERMKNGRHRNDPVVKLVIANFTSSDSSSNRIILNNGIDSVTEVTESTTVDVDTYDMTVKKELSLAALGGKSPQSREFFARLRNLVGRNRTFVDDSLRSAPRKPVTSEEIQVDQSEDEFKKVALCSCSQCRAFSEGSTGSKIRAIAALKDKLGMTSPLGPIQGQGMVFHDDWSKVEILNVNYDELLTDSGIFSDLSRSSGDSSVLSLNSENQSNSSVKQPIQGEEDLRVNIQRKSEIFQPVEEKLRQNNQSSQNETGNPQPQLTVDHVRKTGDPDLNLVKLVLLWKFGNSLVLLRDQSVLHHSRMIVKSRVNLGFQLIYTPYECSSVIYNLMEIYKKEQQQGGNMNKAIVDVYRLFCKSLGRFCTAITYVQLKRAPTAKTRRK